MGKRLSIAGLAGLLLVTGLVPGGTGVAQAATINATWIQSVNTTTPTFTPGAPGPSGIAYRADNNSLIVVDTEVSGTNNIWEYDLDTRTVNYTAVLEVAGEQDATGITLDPGAAGPSDDTLYVSSDGSIPGIYIFEADMNGHYGGPEDGVIETEPLVSPDPMFPVELDTEDPAFDPSTSHLFFLNGITGQVFELDPMTGGFGNGDDVLVTPGGFSVPDDPVTPSDPFPLDWEGLALDTATGNLLVGARDLGADDNPVIHEVTKTGAFVQIINVSDAEVAPPNGGALFEISGLGVQPAVMGGDPKTYWIADRGLSQLPGTNDGRLHRVYPGALPPQTPVPPTLDIITEPVSGNEGTAITFDANGDGHNFGDVLTYSLQAATGTFPTGATINPSTGVFSWTPTEPQGGNPSSTYEVKVVVTDTINGSMPASQDVTINVAEVNQNPVVTANPDILRAEGETVSMAMHATDADLPAQSITWSASGLPAGLSINANTGLISGTIGIGTTAGSPYNVVVTARDNGPGTLTGTNTFVFSVTDTNRSPILNSIGNKTVTRGSTLSFLATASDPDGDGVSFSLVSPPAGATISAGGSFSWTPNVTPGVYNVTIKVTDNGTPVLTDQETIAITVQPPSDPGSDPFIDDDGHTFENAIEWLAGEGITQGCNPPTNDRFCPNDPVTRGQMAAFLVRAFGYSAIADDFFVDDSGSVFENAINRLRTAGVTQGCNPPANNRFCPADNVTRGQMAAFLVRAFDLPAYNGPDRFVDDNGVFEGAIERLAQAGITVGCNPPSNDRFCPNNEVTRGQMAAFLKRALEG